MTDEKVIKLNNKDNKEKKERKHKKDKSESKPEPEPELPPRDPEPEVTDNYIENIADSESASSEEEEDDDDESEEEESDSDEDDDVSFSTTEILSNDPLYFVLSKILMTPEQKNIAVILEEISEKLSTLIKTQKKRKD
jgi:hypothetical protein